MHIVAYIDVDIPESTKSEITHFDVVNKVQKSLEFQLGSFNIHTKTGKVIRCTAVSNAEVPDDQEDLL